jgi:L,D-peptidoglycan transpeptidase YkuD (ErfK/YbiS/YcfS/YnhG family)
MVRIFLSFVVFLTPGVALAQSCPAPLADARRLVLVTADTVNSKTAAVQHFTRDAPNGPWTAETAPVSALIGHNGVGWAPAFRSFARPGEPIKVDGDKRVPAGFYKLGRPFGFGPSSRPGYLRVTEGMTCVDDPRSPDYNTITSRAKVGWQVHGENMWRVPEYRRGLLVDYPTDRAARAGSCIFIHVRRPTAKGTAGCVALPEPQVEALQDFAEGGAVLAVLPRQALERFKGCLP